MFIRTRRSILALTCFLSALAPLSLSAAENDPKVDADEAQQLYSRADDYVSHISENGFSYSYIQFYWKRAQSNIDRIARVYPQTPIGRQVVADQVKLGPYELTYFKERVLPRLEEKKLAAFDAVNCAIFLYNLDEMRWDAARVDAMLGIIEVLCRQQRWAEALSSSFPVKDEYRPLLRQMVFRIAARFNEQKLVDELLANVTPDEAKALWPILGEAMALKGTPREDIAKFLDEHPENEVKLAVLSGMVDREIGIQQAATLKLRVKDGIQKTHYSILKLDVRDDVNSVAKTFFPQGDAAADKLLAKYRAALGQKPARDADVSAHLAYLEYLEVAARFEELARYASSVGLRGDARHAADLKTIELLAEGARSADAATLLASYHKDPALADAAALAEFRGRMDSIDAPLTVRERTFSDLPIKDPCILSQAICEWSLTPNRAIRGAAPWDSVVQKYLPGFDNLPLPKSKDVQDAASTSKPF